METLPKNHPNLEALQKGKSYQEGVFDTVKQL